MAHSLGLNARFAACTIVARNYLSYARILAESFQLHHPDSPFYLVIVDGLPPGVDAGPGVIVIDVDQLGLPAFAEMSFKYDVTELSTAVKPTLLSILLTAYGHETVAYFDPDILIVRPLAEMIEQVGRSDIVLIPHLLEPIPLDGKRPSEQDILIAGAYNLGFIAVRRSEPTMRFLAWWEERLEELCRKSPVDGLMVDQKWIDLAPSLFPGTTVLRDDTYNVAYWNLNARELTAENGAFFVNGRPLSFFHFSGFDPRQQHVLSKHQDRIGEFADTPLGALLDLYAGLQRSHGFDEASGLEYGHSRFRSGVRIHGIARAIYSELSPSERAAFGDPYDDTVAGSFFSWMTAPRGTVLNRFLERLYNLRADLRSAFPDVLGKDRQRFVDWARMYGAPETGFDQVYVEASSAPPEGGVAGGGPEPTTPAEPEELPQITQIAPMRSALPFGVNVVGYLRNESGVGAAGRGYIRALRQAGIPVAPVDVSELSPNRSEDQSLDLHHDGTLHGINLMAVNADQHFVVANHLGEEFFRGRYTIGVWQWELPRFPREWHDRYQHYDEIWVGTSFIVNAVAPSSPIPVLRVPPPLVPAIAGSRERGRQRQAIGSDETLFAFVFDFHSYFERKNPTAVVDAFRRAFKAGEPARLVIKCSNHEFAPDKLEALRGSLGDDQRISIHVGYWPGQDVADLMAACDGYVSLHRSEGIGLTLSHAMSLGKPVIATAWSGNTDFMSVANSLLVRYELVHLAEDVGPYLAGEVWAEPSVEHAAELMRWVHENPGSAASFGARAAADIASQFAEATVAGMVRERVSAIQAQRLERGTSSYLRARTSDVEPTMDSRLGDRAPTHAGTSLLTVALDEISHELSVAEEHLVARNRELVKSLAKLHDSLDVALGDSVQVS